MAEYESKLRWFWIWHVLYEHISWRTAGDCLSQRKNRLSQSLSQSKNRLSQSLSQSKNRSAIGSTKNALLPVGYSAIGSTKIALLLPVATIRPYG